MTQGPQLLNPRQAAPLPLLVDTIEAARLLSISVPTLKKLERLHVNPLPDEPAEALVEQITTLARVSGG